jgi:hypothetical protein
LAWPLAGKGWLAKRLVKRHDGGVEGHENESERYRKIIRLAKGVRERAAESLRRSRVLRKRRGDVAEQAAAAQRRRSGRQD